MSRPRPDDYRIVGFNTGSVIVGFGFLMLVPFLTAVLRAEWPTAVDFIIGGSLSVLLGYAFRVVSWKPGLSGLGWLHGMVVAAFAWIVAVLLGALPYYLSGHFGSYLDATFDVMSGFTTTGLALVQNLDHAPDGLNMWRHLITYVGGQGMVVLALTFLFSGATSGLFKMYVGEGRDERLEPNIIHTARAIWVISLVWLAVGTLALWIVGLAIGMPPLRAFFQGMWVFMAAWSTGGFAPQTQNILYYHSAVYEAVTLVLMIAGSLNFALHYAVWNGRRREIYRNIETTTMFATMTGLTALCLVGLAQLGVYPDVMALLRKGFYVIVSGHTGTGFATIYGRQFALEWGNLAMAAATIAMLMGGSACSTAGGFKGLRTGMIFKSFIQDIRRLVMPETAVVVQKFHHGRDILITDTAVRSAMLIVLLYIFTWLIGTLGGVAAGYAMVDSMFESASVTGNVGLTSGVLSPSMPSALKVLYIGMMWVGRLEFMSVMSLGAFIAAAIRGR
jgi:trk system potassium uptake protein TrkH